MDNVLDVQDTVVVGETEGSVWEFILTELAFVRKLKRPLMEKVDDELAKILKKGTLRQTVAAMDYVELRFKFYLELENKKLNLRHINDFEAQSAQIWYRKLADRVVQFEKGYMKKNGGWAKDRPPKKVNHNWLN